MFRMSLLGAVCVLVFGSSTVSAQAVQQIPTFRTIMKVLRETEVSMEVSGKLKSVTPAEEGIFVKKGELLAEMDDRKILAEVKRAEREAQRKTEVNFAKTSLASAEEELKAKQEANRESRGGAYSPSEMRQVQLEVDKSRASLEKAEEDLEMAGLDADVKRAELAQYAAYAPHDGIVTELKLFPGQSARQGDSVMTLMDLSVLQAEVYVDFKYRSMLHIGDSVEIRPGRNAAAAAEGDIQKASSLTSLDEEDPLSGLDDEVGLPRRGVSNAAQTFGADADAGEVFIGQIKFIKPRVIEEQKRSYVVLSVHVPNPRDNEGHYRLQEGMPVTAVILAGPSANPTSLKTSQE